MFYTVQFDLCPLCEMKFFFLLSSLFLARSLTRSLSFIFVFVKYTKPIEKSIPSVNDRV